MEVSGKPVDEVRASHKHVALRIEREGVDSVVAGAAEIRGIEHVGGTGIEFHQESVVTPAAKTLLRGIGRRR